jgi:NTE family protein
MSFREIAFFRGMPAVAIDALEKCGVPVQFVGGEALATAGTATRHLQVLMRGTVRISSPTGGLDIEEGAGAVWGAGPVTGAPERLDIEAHAGGEALRWDASELERLFAVDPHLRVQLATRLSLRDRRREIEELLRHAFLFRETSPNLIRRLVELSTLAHFLPGEHVCRQGDVGDALFVLVRGEVRIVVTGATGTQTLSVLHEGDCFGETSLISGEPRMASAVAASDAEILIVGKRAFDGLAEQSRAFMRRARALSEERVVLNRPRPPRLVWIDNRTRLSTETLASLVAQALHADHGERTVLLSISGSATSATTNNVVMGSRRLVARLGDPLIETTLQQSDEAYVLCYGVPGEEAAVYSALGRHFATELRFHDHGLAALHHAEKFVHDVWVGHGREHRSPGDLRLPLDGALDASLSHLRPSVREALGRIARAVGHRRVGVALSGGGAWGFAHCVLLRGLVKAGIPIDVLAGSSFGSIVGAMYACRGVDGLEELIDLRDRMGFAAALCMATTWPVEYVAERLMGRVLLADLDPVFLPVAVDVLEGAEVFFRSGTLAAGVRASCAFPGLYGPALHGGRRYVDGAMTNNVPVSALRDEGADFVIASTIMPRPAPRPLEHHASRLGRAWAEISPLGRVLDVTRSLMLLGHSVSRDLASTADVVFSPDLSPYLLNEWGKAHFIVEKAEQQLAPTVAAAVRQYAAR